MKHLLQWHNLPRDIKDHSSFNQLNKKTNLMCFSFYSENETLRQNSDFSMTMESENAKDQKMLTYLPRGFERTRTIPLMFSNVDQSVMKEYVYR